MNAADEQPNCRHCDRAILPAEGYVGILTPNETSAWCLREECLHAGLAGLAAVLQTVLFSPPRSSRR